MKINKVIGIILLLTISMMLIGCDNIYQALSDGTQEVMRRVSNTVGDTPKNAALSILEKFNEIGGNSILTSKNSLQGKRIQGEDNYVGTYTAQYDEFSGTEYLFGGTDIERENGNNLQVEIKLKISNGTAKIFWTKGNEKPIILMENNGRCEKKIVLKGGSNYIGIECNKCTGYVEVQIE